MDYAVNAKKPTTLLNKNYLLLIIGTFISAIGGSTINIVLMITTFEETGNIFYTSLVTINAIVPIIFAGTLFGPFIDTHSRRKVLYGLDLIHFLLLIILAVLAFFYGFIFAKIVVFSFLQGAINAVCQNSYDALFPTVVPEGSQRRSYSIRVLIYPISLALSAPLAILLLDTFDFFHVIIICSVPFLLVAMLELFMDVEENICCDKDKNRYVKDLVLASKYVKKDKGLRSIFTYFFFTTMLGNATVVLLVPYFMKKDALDLYVLALIGLSLGRILSGFIQSHIRIATRYRFTVAIILYIIIDTLGMITFLVPMDMKILVKFVTGILVVIAFNLRISSIHNYIDDENKTRVNSLFTISITIGGILGALIAGLLAEYYIDIKYVPVLLGILSLFIVFLVMIKNKKYVKKIYNVDIKH